MMLARLVKSGKVIKKRKKEKERKGQSWRKGMKSEVVMVTMFIIECFSNKILSTAIHT